MGKENDSILIRQLRKGNHLAFNQLYTKYFSKLYGFSRQITGNKEDAEEIVQEVFVKIWEIRNTLDPGKNFANLLFTISKHKIYNKARQRVYNQAYQNYIQTHVDISNEITGLEIAQKETQTLINQAIAHLPERRREVFILSKVEGFSNKEIADKLNTSLSNIENHINKALKTVRQHMSENEVHLWFIGICLLTN